MAGNIKEQSRGSKTRTPHPAIIIVCEGAETEPLYFKHFIARNKPLRIVICTGAAGKSCREIIQTAIREKKELEKLEGVVDVWCVPGREANIYILEISEEQQ